LTPIYYSFRGLLIIALIIISIGFLIVYQNGKKKTNYLKSTGKIEFLNKKYQNLPFRDTDDYRYLKIKNYPYLFEIYEPNHKPNPLKIDDLKIGDIIDVYYYETENTKEEKINRYIQFIDKSNKAYFIRDGFQKQGGIIVVFLGIIIIIISFELWKRGKLEW
jgi:hypothetical protein